MTHLRGSFDILGPLGRILEPSWAILGPSWAILGHLGAIFGLSWTILGPFWTVSGLRAERKDETWRGKADVRPISQNVHDARARAPFCGILGPFGGHLGAILGPSWGHLGAILGHLGAILGHFKVTQVRSKRNIERKRRCQASLANCARRPSESTILWFLRAILGPSWGHLGAILGHLGPS